MKTVMVVEISNANEGQIQAGLGKAFNDFCKEYKGAGITASVLNDDGANKVLDLIEEEG